MGEVVIPVQRTSHALYKRPDVLKSAKEILVLTELASAQIVTEASDDSLR